MRSNQLSYTPSLVFPGFSPENTFVSNYLSEPDLTNFAKKIKFQGLAPFNSAEITCEAGFPRIIGKTSVETGILRPCADLIKGGVAKS